MGDGEGFEVVEEIEVGDLSEVKETRVIIPPTANVRMRISKASGGTSKDGALKRIRLTLNLVDGVDATGKFKNKAVFADIDYWADPAVKTSEWYQKKQHLIPLRQLANALGYDLKSIKVNDEFISSLVGREVVVNVQVEEETAFNPATGEREGLGTYRNRFRNWKVAP